MTGAGFMIARLVLLPTGLFQLAQEFQSLHHPMEERALQVK